MVGVSFPVCVVHCGGVQYVNHKAFAIRPIFAILKSQEYFRANLSYYMVQSRMYNFTSIDARLCRQTFDGSALTPVFY